MPRPTNPNLSQSVRDVVATIEKPQFTLHDVCADLLRRFRLVTPPRRRNQVSGVLSSLLSDGVIVDAGETRNEEGGKPLKVFARVGRGSTE